MHFAFRTVSPKRLSSLNRQFHRAHAQPHISRQRVWLHAASDEGREAIARQHLEVGVVHAWTPLTCDRSSWRICIHNLPSIFLPSRFSPQPQKLSRQESSISSRSPVASSLRRTYSCWSTLAKSISRIVATFMLSQSSRCLDLFSCANLNA